MEWILYSNVRGLNWVGRTRAQILVEGHKSLIVEDVALTFSLPFSIIYGITVPQPTAERVSQPAGRGNIITTNLTLILADKKPKKSHPTYYQSLQQWVWRKYPPSKLFTVCKTFSFKKIYRSKFSVDHSEEISAIVSENFLIF